MVTRALTTLFTTCAIFLGLSMSANAQSQRAWFVSEPAVACDGHDGAGHGTVYNGPPGDLPPQPWAIVGADVWWIGSVTPSTGGSIGLGLDRGGAYIAFTGFPNSQLGNVSMINTLQDRTNFYHSITSLIPMVPITLGTSQREHHDFNPPIIWNAGDLIYDGYSCAGGGGIQMGFEIYFKVP